MHALLTVCDNAMITVLAACTSYALHSVLLELCCSVEGISHLLGGLVVVQSSVLTQQ
jgi:hypothetical protein